MVCYSLRIVAGDGSNQSINFWLSRISYVTAVGPGLKFLQRTWRSYSATTEHEPQDSALLVTFTDSTHASLLQIGVDGPATPLYLF